MEGRPEMAVRYVNANFRAREHFNAYQGVSAVIWDALRPPGVARTARAAIGGPGDW